MSAKERPQAAWLRVHLKSFHAKASRLSIFHLALENTGERGRLVSKKPFLAMDSRGYKTGVGDWLFSERPEEKQRQLEILASLFRNRVDTKPDVTLDIAVGVLEV